jgi:ABC-type multidrug transport system ATPase subunit
VSALNGVSFQVEQGNILALLGPNGAGKSTLFGCLLGLIHPMAGHIRLGGREVSDGMRKKLGYVTDRIALYPHRTVWENGHFFARLRNQDAEELERQLKRVGLHNVYDRKVRQLSKGMLQRLALAIALCGKPEVLVLDEPFNGLDPTLLDDLQRILREENERGATLLIATHTISAVEPLATQVAILLDGQLAASGSFEELRAQYGDNSLETMYHRIVRRERVGRQEAILR